MSRAHPSSHPPASLSSPPPSSPPVLPHACAQRRRRRRRRRRRARARVSMTRRRAFSRASSRASITRACDTRAPLIPNFRNPLVIPPVLPHARARRRRRLRRRMCTRIDDATMRVIAHVIARTDDVHVRHTCAPHPDPPLPLVIPPSSAPSSPTRARGGDGGDNERKAGVWYMRGRRVSREHVIGARDDASDDAYRRVINTRARHRRHRRRRRRRRRSGRGRGRTRAWGSTGGMTEDQHKGWCESRRESRRECWRESRR